MVIYRIGVSFYLSTGSREMLITSDSSDDRKCHCVINNVAKKVKAKKSNAHLALATFPTTPEKCDT